MKLEHFILGMLNFKSYTGYDLKKYLDTEGRFTRDTVHLSQMYRTLKSMVESGWISFEVEERDSQPDLKIYRITPAGQAVFLQWLRSPYEPAFRFQERGLFDRLRFASMLDTATVLDFLRTELDFRRAQIAKFRPRDRRLKDLAPTSIVDADRIQLYLDLCHEYGASAIDHYVEWLDRTIQRLAVDLPTTRDETLVRTA